MCSIFGAILFHNAHSEYGYASDLYTNVMHNSLERGRDGFGFACRSSDLLTQRATHASVADAIDGFHEDLAEVWGGIVLSIGNARAEPTTEWVQQKKQFDQQPYVGKHWAIVHNGTIANDKELREDIPEHLRQPSKIDSAGIVERLDAATESNPEQLGAADLFLKVVGQLTGSYAILAMATPDGLYGHNAQIYAACNYRPIWYANIDGGVLFASSEDYLPGRQGQMLKPYSMAVFTPHAREARVQVDFIDMRPWQDTKRALVVCSGGLDSVVAATKMQADGYDVELLHFHYGSRAEGPEHLAVAEVAEYLHVNLHRVPMGIYDPKDSPLLRADSAIAGGEAGAEFAHEWVPARNLVMLALATAFCEARGIEVLALGNNLEEAGAYPDNEPEFINRFNAMLPFAVGANKRLNVVMPVGNLMKHEIVELGHQIGAPMHLTWSCYRAGEKHCGTCGPCFMRRTAFEINNLLEVIEYESK